MTSTAQEREMFDVAVIGAGPAGLACALYASRAGLTCAAFERLSPGGQLAQTEHLENYPGYAQEVSGFELGMSMAEQATRFGARIVSEEVTGVDLSGPAKLIDTPFGRYAARAVVVATGARPAKLGLEGEDALQGFGVSYCATCDGNFFRGKRVVVVGGGNTAVGDAIYLSRICEKVTLVHRRDKLRATAVYHERLAGLDNVEIAWNTEAVGFVTENGRVSGLAVRSNVDGSERTIDCSAVFVAVGTLPNTEFLGGALELAPSGHIVAGELGTTAAPGVFAAGDVRTKALRQVVTAVADGANCAEQAVEFLADLAD